MNILIIIGMSIAFLALVCMCYAGVIIFLGYIEELDLVNRLLEYGEKLARRRKRRE